ncbi:MAG TPA: Uma2 family endonuclease [Thermoanaerobaculia bacterium]|nr:Uma2 family endonuclease [Thermoanaerobaculia bacterium]
MAQPAWKPFHGESDDPDDDSGTVLLQRWVERADGTFELLERPPTLEDYLDPQLEDKLIQGNPHALVRRTLADILYRYFLPDEDVFVLEDVKVRFGPGWPGPGPDVSVIRGARDRDPDFDSFDVVKQGALPGLLIEVISPSDARIRKMDEVDKKDLYERVGIPEYLMVDLPRRATGNRFRVRGYRLGPGRRYREIKPDAEGRLLSETTGLRFGAAPDGQWIEVFVAASGERLLTSWEEAARASREAEARREAERRADQSEESRQQAETELVRLRAEIERLKKGG